MCFEVSSNTGGLIKKKRTAMLAVFLGTVAALAQQNDQLHAVLAKGIATRTMPGAVARIESADQILYVWSNYFSSSFQFHPHHVLTCMSLMPPIYSNAGIQNQLDPTRKWCSGPAQTS